MTVRNSIHGKAVMYDAQSIYLFGRPVGLPPLAKGAKYIYVDSGVDALDGSSPEFALGTLDEAFAKCTANAGDVILVMPGHSETITGAGGIAHDVAGVSVIGLGRGGQRPTFLMDGGTTVTYLISANDAYVANLVFNAGHADVATCFNVQTATDAWIDGCEFGDNTTNENFVTCIKSGSSTDNECDGLKVTNCRWFSPDAGCLEFIECTGNIDRPHVEGNFVKTAGTGLASLMVVTAGDSAFNLYMRDNDLINADAADAVTLFVTDQSDNSGMVIGNRVGTLDVAGELVATASSGLYFYENRTSSVPGTTGYALPTADS